LIAELTPAAVVLLALLAALYLHDFTRAGVRRGPHLWIEGAVFLVGAVLIVYPEIARRLARLVGIGRGVDFVIYPLVIWLVRESLVHRRRRHEDEARLTELVRALAIARARTVTGTPPESTPPGS
jgi:hypothetical protein